MWVVSAPHVCMWVVVCHRNAETKGKELCFIINDGSMGVRMSNSVSESISERASE